MKLVHRQDKNENNLPFFSDELISESLAEVVEGRKTGRGKRATSEIQIYKVFW